VRCQGASRASRAPGASGRSLSVRTYIFFPDGLIAVSYFAAAASYLARVVVGLYRCLVAAPVYGCREVGMWREIICDFDLVTPSALVTPQDMQLV